MKLYVCDTSSLVHSPTSLQSLGQAEIIIPIAAYEELDVINHGRNDQAAYNARQVINLIDKLQEQQSSSNVILESGGIVWLEDDYPTILPSRYDESKADTRILNTAFYIRRERLDKEVILVSNDAAMRTKARKYGITTMPLAEDRINVSQSQLYTGCTEYHISPDRIDKFYADKCLKTRKQFQPNEFAILIDENGSSKSALARYDARSGMLIPLVYSNTSPWGIKPRNAQQKFLIEAILNPNIKVVSCPGPAGTGKSLIAIACGGHLVENQEYSKLVIFKPLYVIGPNVGYLPGDLDDKIAPVMDSIKDSLDFIFGSPDVQVKDNKTIYIPKWQYLVERNLLEMKVLTHIRGRSLPNLLIIVEEAQNLSPAEVKTIMTRAGEGTKIIFTGDPEQIDNRYLDAQTNGLTYLTERFKGQECFATVTLTKTERSELAELGAQLL